MPDKLNMTSKDIIQENIEYIAKRFPNALKEVKNETGKLVNMIDFEVLKQELSNVLIDEKQERYQMTWPDKKKSILLANSKISATLRPIKEKSVDFDNTKNLYIEGDNLDVLKLLRETYLNKVQMIYIDPPYNTGNDFVYEDDFSQNSDSYLKSSGQYDNLGNKLFQNNDTNGRFHTDWLNMIYPRLKIARDLLTDDGLIFISIDDHEQHNLKKLCDEIFGERNFLNQFAWVSNITGRQISGSGAAKTYETVLVYCKNINESYSLQIDFNYAKSKMPDSYKGFNKDIRKDKYGEYAIGDTLYNHNRKFNEETRKNLVFSIFYNPETEEIKPGEIGERFDGFVEILPHKNGDGIHKYHAWRWSQKKVIEESYNLIVLTNSTGGYEIYTRIREFNKTLLKDIITNISNGDSEVQKLFNGKKYFDYPKSVDLMKVFLGTLIENDCIVMDFFSGSGTMAQAVMEFNTENDTNHKFILVQLPEKCDEHSEAYKAGMLNICDISETRIKLAIDKIKSNTNLFETTKDLGFRVLKLDSSNMNDVYYNAKNTSQSLFDSTVDNVKSDRNALDLLFQVMLELGIELSAKIDEKEVLGKKYFIVNENDIVACFDNNVSNDVIKELAKIKPIYAVFRDSVFENDAANINCEQLIKSISPSTTIKVL